MPGRRSPRPRRASARRGCPPLLAEPLVEQGRIAAAGAPEPSRRGYWLVAPLPQWRQKKVKALVAALPPAPEPLGTIRVDGAATPATSQAARGTEGDRPWEPLEYWPWALRR